MSQDNINQESERNQIDDKDIETDNTFMNYLGDITFKNVFNTN